MTPSAVYCNLEHFTFYHLSAICHINVQQYAAFETLSHVILLTHKNENKKFTHRTTPFPNIDKNVFQLSELYVATKCPDVIDTYSVQGKLNNKVVPVHTIKAGI